MREIDPKDVPQLMRDGKLEFGSKLEFSYDGKVWTKQLEFVGFRPKGSIFIAWGHGDYKQARFPLPALRDGDPVVVKKDQLRRIFSHFDTDGFINCWINGTNRWTNRTGSDTICWGDDWSLPTSQELSEAGYPEDQINEMMTRWGVK